MKPWEYFEWLKSLDFIHAGMNADYNIQVKDKAVYVSFQQTNGKFDWLLNILFIPLILLIPFTFNSSLLQTVFIVLASIEVVLFIVYLIRFFPKKPYKAMKETWRVHFGIAMIYGSIRDQVMEEVCKLVKDGYTTIYAGGWSQGGGTTQMFVEDCYYQTGIKPILTTFGSLNITWGKKAAKRIADSCADGSFAYSNGSDIVPHVPFWFWGFRRTLDKHIGEKFSWFKVFKTAKYHTAYGDKSLYE